MAETIVTAAYTAELEAAVIRPAVLKPGDLDVAAGALLRLLFRDVAPSFLSLTREPSGSSLLLVSEDDCEGTTLQLLAQRWRAFLMYQGNEGGTELMGTLSKLALPLAAGRIPVMNLSGLMSDVLLVEAARLEDTLSTLRDHGGRPAGSGDAAVVGLVVEEKEDEDAAGAAAGGSGDGAADADGSGMSITEAADSDEADTPSLLLQLRGERLAIASLSPDAVPSFAYALVRLFFVDDCAFCHFMQLGGELTLIAEEGVIASLQDDALVSHLPSCRALVLSVVEGDEKYGLVSPVVTALARGGVTVMSVTAKDHSYLLVEEGALESALTLLRDAGFTVSDSDG